MIFKRSISSHIIVILLFTESTVEIKAVYKDELVFVAYRSVNISSGLTCVYINIVGHVYTQLWLAADLLEHICCIRWGVSVVIHSFIHSFIPLACAECDDSLPF